MIRARSFFRAVPGLVLGLALLATYGSWYLLDGSVKDRAALRFEQEVDSTVGAILDRLKAYNVIMRGATGLFLASERVNEDEFRRYFNRLRLQDTYPGIQSLGYGQYLKAGEREAYLARMRAQGRLDFRIRPEGERDEYLVATYVEPLSADNRVALGFDGLSDPVSADAIHRARDTGRAAISGLLTLLQDSSDVESPGVLMFVPVYKSGTDPGTVEGRRAGLRGMVYGAFRMADLMQGIMPDGPQMVSFAVYDGLAAMASPETLLFDGRPANTRAARTAERGIQFGGRNWTVAFAGLPNPEDLTPPEPMIAASAGVAISIVLYLITVLMMHIQVERRRAAEKLLAAEKQLRQAQKMEAIGQLAGGVAHDFNNLLQVILGNTELLADQLAAQPRLQRLATLTQRAAERGAELTSRLLAFARRQALNPQATDVNRLVRNMEPLLNRALGELIEIRMVKDPGLRLALVDAAQLESAILNLCINARDAMPQGGRLTIETANVMIAGQGQEPQLDLEAGAYVRIAIADQGGGMDPTTMSQAFEPFFTTKEVGKGSGLGLSMVFGFAKQSHGHVKLESEVGRGTTVSLYLPQASQSHELSQEDDGESDGGGQGERILLVEDNEDVRNNVREMLLDLGYHVTCAGTGAEALDLLKAHARFDLLFTDLLMPGQLGGRQLAEEARAISPQLHVLLTTGYSDDTATTSGTDFPLLKKPYHRAELAALLRKVLGTLTTPEVS